MSALLQTVASVHACAVLVVFGSFVGRGATHVAMNKGECTICLNGFCNAWEVCNECEHVKGLETKRVPRPQFARRRPPH